MQAEPIDPSQSEGVVSAALRRLCRSEALHADVEQHRAARVLDRIATQLAVEADDAPWWARLFQPAPGPICGAYLVGDAGRGKTMLMDLFFAEVPIARKRRLHFHEFMDEVHAGIAAYRATTKGRGENADPIAAVTRPLRRELRLLCLDEFHVNDITNAMLLGRLFEQLFAGGVVLVATSNVAPDRLYEHGLNRALFLPFVAILRQRTELVLLKGDTDYRRLKFGGEQVFRFGTASQTKAEMEALWRRMTGGVAAAPAALPSLGRSIHVPQAAMGAARFEAADLIETPLGARDYLRIAHAYDALMIENVPRFERTRSDAAKRFILLIDTLYDRGVKLAASFAVPLDALAADDKTRFEFGRTLSRLIEMSSRDYLEAPHREGPQTKG